MQDVQEQLAELRRRIARINRKYAALSGKPADPVVRRTGPDARPHLVHELMSGQVVRTPRGAHFETEKLYERHKRHGSVGISDLIELPEDLLSSLSEEAIASSHPRRWAFFDVETTGLPGAAGTCAFLVGVGSIHPEGFRLRQFFMRNYGEEASLLSALSQHLSQFDVLITYNGMVCDVPLLETRSRMLLADSPFERMRHLDLLFGARRLWKLRLESCRLIELENQILGVEREGDLPGEMIPYYYFDYLRTQQAFRLVPIFHHNAMDIVSLACLTAIVPVAFRSPEDVALRHGADLVGLARWLRQADRHELALRLLRRAVDLGLPDELLFRTLWDIGVLERKLGRVDAALCVFSDLASSPNTYRMQALQELAKHYEHKERDYALALETTHRALALLESPELRRREERLRRRLSRAAGA